MLCLLNHRVERRRRLASSRSPQKLPKPKPKPEAKPRRRTGAPRARGGAHKAAPGTPPREVVKPQAGKLCYWPSRADHSIGCVKRSRLDFWPVCACRRRPNWRASQSQAGTKMDCNRSSLQRAAKKAEPVLRAPSKVGNHNERYLLLRSQVRLRPTSLLGSRPNRGGRRAGPIWGRAGAIRQPRGQPARLSKVTRLARLVRSNSARALAPKRCADALVALNLDWPRST